LRPEIRSSSFRAVPFRRSISLMLCCAFILALAGCRPGAGGGDEQKEPYFLRGKNRLQARDYVGAIEGFEKALDVNPRSASAHFELGILYEQQQGDFAAALYHYQKAVTLRGDMPSAELARQRIQECKRELAKTVITPVSTQNLQKTVDDLRAENQVLKQQLQSWQSYYASRGLPTNAPPYVPPVIPQPNNARAEISPARTDTTMRTDVTARAQTPPSSPSRKLHTISAGENFGSIARRYRISTAALQSANPTIDERRLRPGQALVIPPP
jgi:tetratricopeptide (TPR) repeat protein